jgi:hypothetical protein
MAAITIPCPATLLPTAADLTNIFKQVANIPSLLQVEIEQLRAQAESAVQTAVRNAILNRIAPYEQKIDQVNSILNSVEKVLGNFPISVSKPIFPGLKIPDMQWERIITALCNEYHLYVQAKIMELIDKVLPINLEIPVLGISINPVKLFSDPAYRAQLKAQFAEKAEFFMNLIPEIYRTFEGTLGIFSRAIQADAIFAYIMSKLQNGALTLIYNALGGLINKFKSIWDTLGLPSLPALLNLNVEGIITALIGSLKAQLNNLKRRLINAPAEIANEIADQILSIQRRILNTLKSISIAGFGILDLIGGEIESFVESIEQQIDRLIEVARNFGEIWPQYLIKQWMGKVAKFFEKIGLSALTQWITFNFCQFLTLIGMPKSISVETGVPGIRLDVVLTESNLDPEPIQIEIDPEPEVPPS